jgi:hypothetical protein
MNAADDKLVDELREAFATIPTEPSVEEIDALHTLVVANRVGGTVVRLHRQPARASIGTSRLIAAAAACVALLVGVAVIATRSTGDTTTSSSDHRNGSGVSEIRDARMTLTALRIALDAHDLTRIARARDAVVAALASLRPRDRSTLENDAAKLMRDANAALHTQPDTHPGSPPASTTRPQPGDGEIGTPTSNPTPGASEQATDPQDSSPPSAQVTTTTDGSAPSNTDSTDSTTNTES